MGRVVALAEQAGVSPSLVKAGVLAVQGTALVKAAKGKVRDVPRGAHPTSDSVHVAISQRKRATDHLKDELRLADGDGFNAHHLIPVEALDLSDVGSIMLKAAQGGFHFNGAVNGRKMGAQHGFGQSTVTHNQHNADVIAEIRRRAQQGKIFADASAAKEVEKIAVQFREKINAGEYWQNVS